MSKAEAVHDETTCWVCEHDRALVQDGKYTAVHSVLVSVRLTEEEEAEVKKEGKVSDVIRAALKFYFEGGGR